MSLRNRAASILSGLAALSMIQGQAVKLQIENFQVSAAGVETVGAQNFHCLVGQYAEAAPAVRHQNLFGRQVFQEGFQLQIGRASCRERV